MFWDRDAAKNYFKLKLEIGETENSQAISKKKNKTGDASSQLATSFIISSGPQIGN